MKYSHSQLQQGQVGHVVVCPVLALALNIVLERTHGLWVVAVEAREDLLNVLRAGCGISGHDGQCFGG